MTRRLPADFVRFWDPFVARHLVPLLTAEMWERRMPLNFLLGDASAGPMTGVVLPSADRVGRRFPLTVAVALRLPGAGIPVAAADWFADIHAIALGATEGDVGGSELAEQLEDLPFPSEGIAGAPVRGLLLWGRPSDAVEIEPEAPAEALERIFQLRREFG